MSATPSPPHPMPDAARGAPDRRIHRRVRAAMYLAFLALGLATLVNGWAIRHLERLRTADVEAIGQVAALRVQTQAIARHAARLLAPREVREAQASALTELREALAGTDEIARALAAPQEPRPSEGTADRARAAAAAWGAAHARLRTQVDALVRAAEGGSAGAAGPAGGADPAALAERIAAVERETDRSADAAAEWQAVLAGAAQGRAAAIEQTLPVLGAMLLLLLGGLTLAVVEPTARAVRGQVALLEQQALELHRLALVAENTSAIVVVSDRDDQVQWVNAAFSAATGWSLAEVQGGLLGGVLHHPAGDDDARRRLREAVADGRGVRTEILCRRRDGAELWLDVDLRPVHDAQGAPAGFVSVSTDVTARVAEQRKRRLLWAALPAGVIVQSAAGEIVDANPVAERLLGAGPGELLGRDASDPGWRIVREDLSPYPAHELPALRTLRSGRTLANETLGLELADGTLRWLLLNTEPQRDDAGEVIGVIVCFVEITERRALQDRLQESARTDALTGLPNRVVALERVQRALAHARAHAGYGFAVLFMDFDRFKQVNDTLGHGAGDELLRQIAARLRHALRPGDEVARVETTNDLAARLGGDEFVVVLDGVRDAGTVRSVADRLLAEMAEPYTVLDQPVQSSASIGVVLSSSGADSAEELLRNADTAMYEAKRAGRGRWVLFDRSMHDRLVHTLAVEQDLRRALREDELFVVYQPVVDLANGALAGVEALVRWQHPERGLVAPPDFIAIAEECGLIEAVGRLVLEKACRQFMDWQHRLGERAPRQLAVNLSRAQLERPGLVDDVRRVLAATGMAAAALQLEVTESLAAQDERVQATLRELKSHGVRLALDDFGTGYSSLACLHQLQVDTVKIDRSFVRHAETVEYHRVLIEATIRVARTLGMGTVAEGIETPGQARLMRALACDRGQGWLYGKPMSGEDLEHWQHDGSVVGVVV